MAPPQDPPPNSSAGRPPAGSGRLCDGRTAASNLQRRQWGAFVAVIPKPTGCITYTKKTACLLSGVNPFRGWGVFFFFCGDRVSVHLLPACGPGMRLFDDAHTHTCTQHVHVPNTHTHTHVRTRTHTRHTQTWETGCDMMEPPPGAKFDSRCHFVAGRGRSMEASDLVVSSIDVCASDSPSDWGCGGSG